MKDKLRSLLSLSSAERKGALALVVIIAIITGIQAYMTFHSVGDTNINDTLWNHELADFEKQLTLRTGDPQVIDQPGGVSEEYDVPELFRFDPNSVSAVDMKRLGFNSRQIRTLINYRLRGGRFYKSEDLNKIYGMSSALLERLAPYICIPGSVKEEYHLSAGISSVEILDINLADSSEFERLKGIGPVLSARIIRYRSLLGGFYDSQQLKEVYGLEDSVLALVSRHLNADTSALIRLNPNMATEQELARHPYIGKYTAKGIIKYRTKVQTIKSVEELVINGLVTEEEFEKIKHYLRL
jgi:DNA uptake protein ComE-like DNA-binding protein